MPSPAICLPRKTPKTITQQRMTKIQMSSPARTLAFTNARLVDPASGRDEHGVLVIDGPLIKEVLWDARTAPKGVDQVVDLAGAILSPGLIDMQVFVGEPGAEHKETLASASRAAAAGGVTTMIVMPNTNPVIDEAALVDFIERRASGTALVNIHPMAAITKGARGEEMCEMGLLREAGAVAFTDGRRSIANAAVMRRAMAYATLFDALICHHPEDPNLAAGTAMNSGELATRLGLTGCPKEAETIMLSRDIALARLTGVRYHAMQISCAESVEIIRRAKADGVKITCGVSAHHLSLNEIGITGYRTYLKVRPPLRSEQDRQALVRGLAEGVIDIVCSAHDPQAPEDKRLPFAEAANGCVGLETLLPVLLQLCHNGEMSLLDALAAATSRPARLLGLEAGILAPGAPADLTVIDPDALQVVRPADLHSKSPNTPFDGHKFSGRAIRTYVAGEPVFTHAYI